MSGVVRKITFSALDWMYSFGGVVEPIGAVVLSFSVSRNTSHYYR